MTAADFVNRLTSEVPEASDLVAEHLHDNDGELLVHLLLSDILRYCLREFHVGHNDTCARCLGVVAQALTDGGDHLRNAVQVSFVEHAGSGPRETPTFIGSWPQPLRDELDEQRD